MLRPALAALLLAAPLAVAHPAAASAIDLGKVMPLGDSITEGFPNNGDGGYIYDFVGTRTSNAPNPSPFPEFDPHHAGYAGYQVLNNNNPGGGDLAGFQPDERSLAQQQLDANPDLVLLHAGINDTFQGNTQLQIADDLNTLVDQIYAAAPATHSADRLALTDLAGSELATLHDAAQPHSPPLAALAHIDDAHTHAAPGQLGLALDAGPNAAQWHLDRLTLTDATRHGLPNLHMFEGNALPEPSTAVIALGAILLANTRSRPAPSLALR